MSTHSTSEMLASICWWSVESWAVVDVSRSSLEMAVSSEDAVCCWCWERLVVSVLNLYSIYLLCKRGLGGVE